MLVTDKKLKRLIRAKIAYDTADKEFGNASADANLNELDRSLIVSLDGEYYMVQGQAKGRPLITKISAPRQLE